MEQETTLLPQNTMQEDQEIDQQNNYKLFLFQDLYQNIKHNNSLRFKITNVELTNFMDQLKQKKELATIFIKVIEFYQMDSPQNAIFFADKLQTLMNQNKIAIYLLAECYYLNSDYVKVNFLFHKYQLLIYDENYLLLASKSLVKIKQYEQAIKTLTFEVNNQMQNNFLNSEKYYLLGKCNQYLENREEAENNFVKSLQYNPSSFQTFENLLQVKEINLKEFKSFIKELNFGKDLLWVKNYYKLYLNYSQKTFKTQDPSSPNKRIDFDNFNQKNDESKAPYRDPIINELIEKENTNILFLKAQKYFQNYQINAAYDICIKILEQNYFHFQNLFIYSEILVEKKLISELFTCSTNLAENYPDNYITYHVFGMYYFLLKKFETSRKYFNKAIQLNKDSLQSWIMLGHSFANQEESEQAMNVYRSCIRLFPNSHLPHIYIGMEYLRINNLKTALLSFNQAKQIVGPDPIVYNEIGCIYLKEKKYNDAKKVFNSALRNCQSNGILWLKHIILNNLGNAHRKYKEYQQAIECYEQSLKLCPEDPAVLFSLAFCYHLIQKLEKAIVLYHKVVCMKYDTHFVNHMLMRCLNDLSESKKNLEKSIQQKFNKIKQQIFRFLIIQLQNNVYYSTFFIF